MVGGNCFTVDETSGSKEFGKKPKKSANTKTSPGCPQLASLKTQHQVKNHQANSRAIYGGKSADFSIASWRIFSFVLVSVR